MQLHNLKRRHKNKKPAEVGRGGKRGKTSGRGTKGQRARAGRKLRPEMRDIIKKLPKMRGRGVNPLNVIGEKPVVIKLSKLANAFAQGSEITPEILAKAGLIKRYKGKMPKVKILADAEDKSLQVKFQIKNVAVSASVKEAVEKAGGMISQ